MGSLFYINVPIREFEVTLRQQEQNITVTKEIENIAKGRVTGKGQITELEERSNITTNLEINDTTGLVDGDGNDDTFESQGFTIAGHLITNKDETDGKVDIYEATVNGKKANIVVSQDSMAIYTIEDEQFSDRRSSFIRQLIKSKNEKEKDELDEEALQTIINNTFLERHLEDSLKKFNIENAKWGYSIDGNFAEVNFTVEADKSEEIIQYMLTLGIGVKYQSTLSVCAAVVFYNQHTVAKNENLEEINIKEEIGVVRESELTIHPSQTFTAKFKASIKSRLTVAQVIQTVQGNAVLTFDYIILIIVAGIIASLGLLENSSVSLVASMLISPLMGPIMAGCFGAIIHDLNLIKTGIVSELVGLGICILVGFFFGICVTWAPFPGPWDWENIERWPTDEMVSRSKLRGMAVGVLIAIPSGVGVALSILAGNAGSLVGVAISASLLPPAVNAGLFWGISAVISVKEQFNNRPSFLTCKDLIGPPDILEYYSKNHTILHCENVLVEFAVMGIYSFGLTLVNIMLILTIGAVVLKIKEVAPHTTKKTMHRFWKEDLKVMRAYNIVHGSFDKEALLTELINNENADEIKEDLANDRIFNQVNRQNLFGPAAVILNIDLQSEAAMDEINSFDFKGGGDQESVQPQRRERGSISGGTSLWGGFTGLFVRRRQSIPLPSQHDIEAPNAEIAGTEIGSSEITKEVKGRPRLVRSKK